MQTFFCCLLVLSCLMAAGQALPETPQQSLNNYVAFLNQSADELAHRFQMVQTYCDAVKQVREKPDFLLRLPSSGPLEEYYYKTAMASSGLTPAEKQRLTASTQALWQLVTKLDQTGKTLETYVRLKDYQRDGLKQSDALLTEMQGLFGQFSQDKEALYAQIQWVYRRYQPYLPTNGYLYAEKEMEKVLLSQKQLIDSLSFYVDEAAKSVWPVERVQQSILTDDKLLAGLGNVPPSIDYPASDMVIRFRSAIQSMQAIKRRAVDDYTFAARQSSRHGNAVYKSLLASYNQDLLASHQSFVQYSTSARRLLNFPKLSPKFLLESPPAATQKTGQTPPFIDLMPVAFPVKPAPLPATEATFQALTTYVEFINESLRQLHKLYVVLRNYQSSAEHYRNPDGRRGSLTYSHEEYNLPLSEHQLLVSNSRSIPQPYRSSLNSQADVLLSMLKEMDGLSIELISYTNEKQYLQDQLHRSDAILDRYVYLFDTFDQKKERLYADVRRIHESYPPANPSSSWYKAGKALLRTIDDNEVVLFGIKAYLKDESTQLPSTDKLMADARTLIQDEYQNLKGLTRYGRSNGLCPYSPYEDLAENTLRFAEKAQNVKVGNTTTSPFESIFYFYNNELIYQYNKFSELAKVGVLKTINQPDLVIFRRPPPPRATHCTPILVKRFVREQPK